MSALMGFVVVGTSIWMAADAAQIDYDKRDVQGLAAMGPVAWLFAGLLLWIVAFPLYLIKRGELQAAAARRRQLMAAGAMPNHLPPAGPRIPGATTGAQGPAMMPTGPGPYSPPAAQPAGSIDLAEAVRQIEKLDELRRSGILTDAEFQQKKTEILART
jgi:hypothetical protein